MQQCLSTPHFLCFQVRFRGETIYFYFGRGAAYQGFNYSSEKPPAELRVQDRFLQFSRKYWRGLRISKIDTFEDDRVIELSLFFKGGEGKLWFFWRGRDLFFAHFITEGQKIDFFKSWVGKCRVQALPLENVSVAEVFEGLGYGEGKGKQREGDLSIEKYFEDFKNKLKVLPIDKKSTKKEVGLKEKIKKDLRRFEILSYLESQTKTDLSEVKQIGEGRFSVNFKGIEGHFKKREHLFNKIKRWKKSKLFLECRLQQIEDKKQKNQQDKPAPNLGKTIQPVWKEIKSEQSIKKNESYIEFLYKNKKCFLGRSALENDFIRKEKASRDDTWLHLENHKSGHLIIKTPMSELLPEDIVILASAIVELNGIDLLEIPIIYTKVRFLKGVKGAPGMVNYKKEKHIIVYFDQDWRQKLTGIEVIFDG